MKAHAYASQAPKCSIVSSMYVEYMTHKLLLYLVCRDFGVSSIISTDNAYSGMFCSYYALQAVPCPKYVFAAVAVSFQISSYSTNVLP